MDSSASRQALEDDVSRAVKHLLAATGALPAFVIAEIPRLLAFSPLTQQLTWGDCGAHQGIQWVGVAHAVVSSTEPLEFVSYPPAAPSPAPPSPNETAVSGRLADVYSSGRRMFVTVDSIAKLFLNDLAAAARFVDRFAKSFALSNFPDFVQFQISRVMLHLAFALGSVRASNFAPELESSLARGDVVDCIAQVAVSAWCCSCREPRRVNNLLCDMADLVDPSTGSTITSIPTATKVVRPRVNLVLRRVDGIYIIHPASSITCAQLLELLSSGLEVPTLRTLVVTGVNVSVLENGDAFVDALAALLKRHQNTLTRVGLTDNHLSDAHLNTLANGLCTPDDRVPTLPSSSGCGLIFSVTGNATFDERGNSVTYSDLGASLSPLGSTSTIPD